MRAEPPGCASPRTGWPPRAAAEQALPLLAAAADAGAPVFVHPGPVADGAAGTRQPAWWAPATGYVAQQHAAWHAFHAAARPQLPSLRVIFALLAGLAPLHAERTAARGGPGGERSVHDPLVFYDTSSYGPEAVRRDRGGGGDRAAGARERLSGGRRAARRRGARHSAAGGRGRGPARRARAGARLHLGARMTAAPLAELRETLLEFAGQPDRWLPLVRHDADERTYVLLHRDERVELYVVCWMPGHDTGFHDHDESAAAIAVVHGAVSEERLSLNGTVSAELVAGETVTIAREAIHRVRHTGEGPAVTLHAYSPPLERVGTYEVADDGALLRHPRAADVPLEAVA